MIALEMGGSSNLCATLQPGEPVILMGPTGAPTHIEGGETVILCGGGLGNAVLFSIGAAFRAADLDRPPVRAAVHPAYPSPVYRELFAAVLALAAERSRR